MSRGSIRNLDELFNHAANAVSYTQRLNDDLPEHVTRQRVADTAKLRSLVHRYLRTLMPYVSKESSLSFLTVSPVWELLARMSVGVHSIFDAAYVLSPETALSFHSDTHLELRGRVLEEIKSLLLKMDTENILYRS